MHRFLERMLGAARLQTAIYEEVEHDSGATGQAGAVVLLAALAAGIGALAAGGFGLLVLTAIAALVGWLIWAAIIWAIGTKLLPEDQTEADIGQLLRTMGFAASPGLLRVFGFIPLLGALILIIVDIWMLFTMVVAVRQALDYRSTMRAIGVCVLGWLVQLLIVWLIGGGMGIGAGGGGHAVANSGAV